jgi:hypothetical protein
MAFTQDIPYGIPELDDDGLLRVGFSPAPIILLTGYADCDSKAALFAGILGELIAPEDILFLLPEHIPHALTAVRGEPTSRQHFVTHQGRPYLLAEVTGPGRLPLGAPGATPMETTRFEVIPYVPRVPALHPDADYTRYGWPVFRLPNEDGVHIGPGRVALSRERYQEVMIQRALRPRPGATPGREP